MKRNTIGHHSTSRIVLTMLLALFVAFTALSGCAKDAAINDANTDSFVDIPSVVGRDDARLITLSPDGSLIAVSVYTEGVKVFETKTGTIVSELSTKFSNIYFRKLQFTTDNKKLMFYDPRDFVSITLSIFDITTPTAKVVCNVLKSGIWINDAHISDDGNKIIALYDNNLFNVYSGTNGSLLKTLHTANFRADRTTGFGFDRSEDAVIFRNTQTPNSSFVVWSITNDTLIRTINAGSNDVLRYSEDGITFGALNTGTSPSYYSFFNTMAGKKFGDLAEDSMFQSTNIGYSLFLTKDNIYSASSANSIGEIKILRIVDGSTIFAKSLPSGIYFTNIVANRQQTHIAVATHNNFIRIWKFQ